jgi:hypothetical protein
MPASMKGNFTRAALAKYYFMHPKRGSAACNGRHQRFTRPE